MAKQQLSSRMPDTPWHIGYAKKEESDPRRHKSRCIYLKAGKCRCGSSGAYTLKCPGSSHCTSYAENEEQDEVNKREHESIDNESWERANDYKTRIRKSCKKTMQTDKMKYWKYRIDIMSNCPFCGEKFRQKTTKKDIAYRRCEYCGAIYHIISNADIDIETLEFLVKKRS